MGQFSSISDVLRALRRQAWLILLVLAVGLPFAYRFAMTRPHLYEAVAVLGIQEMREPQEGFNMNRQLDEIQSALLSRDNVAQLVERFELFPDLESRNERIGLARGAISINKLIDPSQSWRPDVQPYGLSVTVRLGDPKQAADLANALLDSVLTEDARRTSTRATATLDQSAAMLEFLLAEEERIQASINDLENQIADFREANIASLPEGLSAQREQLSRLVQDRMDIDREIIRFEGSQDQLRSEVFQRERDLLEEQRVMIVDAISEIEVALAAAPLLERQLGGLTRRLSALQAEMDAIVARRAEAALNQQFATQGRAENMSILESAVPPEYPVTASRKKTALLGAAAVAALALGLALAREILDPVIRTAAQLQRELGIVPIVVIPPVVSHATVRRRRSIAALFLLSFAVFAGVAGTANARAAAPAHRGASPGMAERPSGAVVGHALAFALVEHHAQDR